MGEWGTSIKELGLLGFQQRIGRKIPSEEEEDMRLKGGQPKQATIRQRRWRAKKKYEDYLRQLKEMKNKNK